MAHRWWPKAKGLVSMGAASGAPTFALLLVLALAVACGAAATATPVPKPAAKPEAPKAPVAAAPAAPKAAPTLVPTALPQPTPTPVLAAVGKRGGTVPAHHYASPDIWDPHATAALQAIGATSPLYNQLVEFNPETDDLNDIRGDLAESWALSKDGLTYTFRLVKNAKWWDGKPVTAEDVVFTLARMLEKDKPRPRSGTLIRPYYESSRVIDPFTVEITTKFPSPTFLPILAVDYLKILPKHHLETGLDLNNPDNQLGSGPFKLKRYKRDVSIEYERNPNYFKPNYPYFDGMTYFIIIDKGTVIGAFKTEQVLMAATMVSNLQTPDSLRLEEDMKGKLTAHRSPPIGIVSLMMNTKVKPFDDVKVRRALNLALDRQSIIKTISGGVDQLGAPMAPGFWWGPTNEEMAKMPGLRQPKDADIAEAKRLLAEAGLAQGFKTTISARTAVEFVDLAQLLADQLRKLNIDATVRPMEPSAGFVAYQKGDWELGAQGEGPVIMDPDVVLAALYRKGGVRNYSNWSHPRIDELFELQTKELDQAKRKIYLDEVSNIILNQDTHWANLYWTVRLWLVNSKIKNFHMAPTVNAMFKNEHLWLEK